jgi:hypothetical protein
MNRTFVWMGFVAAGIAASWVGCSSNANTGATSTHGTGGATTSTGTKTSTGSMAKSSSSTTGVTTGSSVGGAGVGGGVGGSLPDPFECTVPAQPPSNGACVMVQGGGGSGPDGGTPDGGNPEGGTDDGGTPDAGTGSGGSGAGGGGAGGGGSGMGIQCNPVTNAPCSASEQCDTNFDMQGNLIGFICWPSNSIAVCMSCDPNNNMACGPGLTCFTYDGVGDSACTKYCCTDADCGSGKCSTGGTGSNAFFSPLSTTLGVCDAM